MCVVKLLQHNPSVFIWGAGYRLVEYLIETKEIVVSMIADICITSCWWSGKSKSTNISPVVGYSWTGKVHTFICSTATECDLYEM